MRTTSAVLTLLAALVAAAPAAHAADTIRMLSPTWPGFAPVYVANDLGYFAEEGLEVIAKFEDDRANVMAAMERGDIEVDMRTVGEHQGAPRDPSTPGVIIGTIDVSLGGDGVVADAAIKSAADMKGKVFAVEPNIPARLLMQLELKKAGMTLADVQVKDIATADSIAVFGDPSVAAVANYQPYLSQLLKITDRPGAHILVSSNDYPGIITDIITARNEALKQNPEMFRKFLRGIYRAIDFYHKDPQKFLELAGPHFKLTAAEVKDTIDSSLVYTSYEDAAGYMGTPGAPGKLYELFDTVMQLNLENGAANHKLEAAQQIDSSVIDKLFEGKKR